MAWSRQRRRSRWVDQAAIDMFADNDRQLEAGATGFILEHDIEPLTDPDLLADVTVDEAAAREALAATVIVKLNGGLGTRHVGRTGRLCRLGGR